MTPRTTPVFWLAVTVILTLLLACVVTGALTALTFCLGLVAVCGVTEAALSAVEWVRE